MTSDRDPVNELYDRGCDLVEAATAIRRAARSADAARAAPAVLGCIETALDELAAASDALERVTHQAMCREAPDGDGEWVDGHARMRSAFSYLERGLRDAHELAATARARASFALARAGITRRATPAP